MIMEEVTDITEDVKTKKQNLFFFFKKKEGSTSSRTRQ